ncbi:MAG: hypothetical protein DRP83_01595 [Planctomycetota bacterium]|nr:MAG: hypothetical protein DRP83_01595 [Planctomycetota bacterium]
MRKFAQDVSRLAHDIGKMDVLAVKVASENGSAEAQRTCAQVADGLYDVMLEKAASDCEGDVCVLVEKMAEALEMPAITLEFKAKLAAAAAVDAALSGKPLTKKTASAKLFGREFIAELLREVI